MSSASDQHFEPKPAEGGAGTPSVLVVASTPARRTALVRAMRLGDVACGCVASVNEAAAVLAAGPAAGTGAVGPAVAEPADRGAYDAVLIDVPDCTDGALEAVRALTRHDLPALVVCATTDLDRTVAALRAGAADVIPAGLRPRELSRRVRAVLRGRRPRGHGMGGTESAAAAARARAGRGQAEPSESVMNARHSAATAARREPQDHLTEAATRFAGLIRGELDVESLLRQLLEFILAHAGPTNAAVFLPGSSGDFSLGAYVNYTCPKETVEVLLDHLANVAAPRLEHTVGVLTLTNEDALRDRIGDGADWLSDNHLLAFTCRDPGDADAECLAVVTLFRDGRTPFDPVLVELARRLGPVFGQQLGRVVRIHHRHLPKDKWTALGDPIDDAGDSGGMAA